MALNFKFRKEKSPLFGEIYRPVAQVFLWSQDLRITRHPECSEGSRFFGFQPQNDIGCVTPGSVKKRKWRTYSTAGIGGEEKVYLLKERLKVRLGKWEQEIPIGFLERDEVPPLLGRQDFLEKFDTFFSKKHVVSFTK